MLKPKVGFIGQGYIGKNYADDFERRGYEVVRYALEEPYVKNGDKLARCDVIFVAVPTPTNPNGFDGHIVKESLSLVPTGKIVIIKSTVLPGITEELQTARPDLIIMNSPEFLSEATAAHDAANPTQNIVGIPMDTPKHREAATLVLSILPEASKSFVCRSVEAELFKYAHNMSGYVQVVLFNIIYDLAKDLGCDWEVIQKAVESDPLISGRYAKPVHKSGRGAGGHCFIKDFEAFSRFYHDRVGDMLGGAILKALKEKNVDLLIKSGKDIDLLREIYGDEIINTHSKG